MRTDYRLLEVKEAKRSTLDALRKLWPLLAREKHIMLIALLAVLLNSLLSLFAPRLIAHAIDTSIPAHDYDGLLFFSGLILLMYLVGLVTGYVQTRLMGGVGQRVLFRLRATVFAKIQDLPVAFFNQNKAGDLISRLNNDTDKINQFFSQVLVQFMANLFLMVGAGVFLVSLNPRLGGAALVPALILIIVTRLLSGWIKRRNKESSRALGRLSSEIQESLENFKVIVAFDRRDYFEQRFTEVSQNNYEAGIRAGIANNVLTPIYTMASGLGQLIILAYGLYLISLGQFSIGLLISFLAYANNFYNPLRHLASLWSSFQGAMASWDRVHDILSLESDLCLECGSDNAVKTGEQKSLLEFRDVCFSYSDGDEVLKHINLTLEPGKKYALVGPTGGGKTTTASLMARLYDPSCGQILFEGEDIRSLSPEVRTEKIGFILQEPYLFSGTLRDNIAYGHPLFGKMDEAALQAELKEAGLDSLLDRFEAGLGTEINAQSDNLSLGQKQLIAFIRAVLRRPALLILDEATANIDTVTERLLGDILEKLPATTTQVIIAHRLNTIANADVIYFVNAGQVQKAGSMQQALDLLLHNKRES